MTQNRKNFIDGLPSSYDYNYVLKTNKNCQICLRKIARLDIENNSLICTEDFDFYHKNCLLNNNYEIIYSNPKDSTSMIKLKKIEVIIRKEELNLPLDNNIVYNNKTIGLL